MKGPGCRPRHLEPGANRGRCPDTPESCQAHIAKSQTNTMWPPSARDGGPAELRDQVLHARPESPLREGRVDLAGLEPRPSLHPQAAMTWSIDPRRSMASVA